MPMPERRGRGEGGNGESPTDNLKCAVNFEWQK